MSNKSNVNNAILHKLLVELLGEDFEFIVYSIFPTYTTLVFGEINVRKFDKCNSVVQTLISFGLVRVQKYSLIDGVHFYNLEFVK